MFSAQDWEEVQTVLTTCTDVMAAEGPYILVCVAYCKCTSAHNELPLHYATPSASANDNVNKLY